MYEILCFCSALLALFISIPLLAMRRHRAANVWIGLFVLSIALLSFASTLWYNARPELLGLLDWPITALGGFYYCYVRSMIGLGNGPNQALHFLPLGLFAGLLLWARLIHDLDFDLIFLAYEVLATAYAVAAGWRLHQYRRQLRNNYSSLKNRDLLWLSWLSAVVVVILLNCVLTSFLHGWWGWLLLFNRVLILYFVGWFGLRQAAVFLPVAEKSDVPVIAALPEVPGADAEKYSRSGMTQAARARIEQKLRERMGEARDFLENDLTLTELAERTGTSPQLLSQYLNDTLGLNFFDYINGLRVTEVQRMMVDPVKAPTTLLDLAFAAGFNSKSTFNAAFRKIGGMTPSEWRRVHVRASEPIR